MIEPISTNKYAFQPNLKKIREIEEIYIIKSFLGAKLGISQDWNYIIEIKSGIDRRYEMKMDIIKILFLL